MLRKKWYKWGENRVIFKDPVQMIDKIQNYIDGKQNKDFGNWQEHPELIDPYKDNLEVKSWNVFKYCCWNVIKKIFQILMQL